MGKFGQAIESYTEALHLAQRHEDQANIISCKAYLLHKLGKLQEAEICFTMAESFFISDTR